jgi:NADPH:quinone reductase-like Zn-dependent oxidoreductase
MKMNSTLTAPPITAFAAPQARTMQAIVQDKYGSFSALELRHIDKPPIADDDVFMRVQAASVHIGDWYSMTGLPYILRVVGLGFRKPKAFVRGMDVAGTVEAVGKNVSSFRPATLYSAHATVPSPSTHVPERTRSRSNRQTSLLSKLQLYPPPPWPPSRLFAT